VSAKPGRPLGRPRCRASFLGHSETSPERGGPVFLLPPVPPPPRTALGCGGLLTLTLRGKAMDGFEEQQERNRPQLSPPSLGNRRNGCRFPTSVNRPAALPRGAFARSLPFPTNGTYNRQTQTLAPQSTRPPNRGRLRDTPAGDKRLDARRSMPGLMRRKGAILFTLARCLRRRRRAGFSRPYRRLSPRGCRSCYVDGHIT